MFSFLTQMQSRLASAVRAEDPSLHGGVIPAPMSSMSSVAATASVAAAVLTHPTDEKGRLETERLELCGRASNGSLNTAWKAFEAKKELVTELPAYSAKEAESQYLSLDARYKTIVRVLAANQSLARSLENPSAPLDEPANAYLLSIRKSCVEERLELCGMCSNGSIDRAWKEYDRLKATSPDSAETAAAFGRYKTLDEQRVYLEQALGAIDRILTLGSCSSCDCKDIEAIQWLVNKGSEKMQVMLRALTGSDSNGEIDKAWKVFDALRALEHYQKLEARRTLIETRLTELSRAPAAASGGGSSESRPAAGGCGAPAPALRPVAAGILPRVSAHSLINNYSFYWNIDKSLFDPIPFDESAFKDLLALHNAKFPCVHNTETEYGSLEVKTVEAGTRVFVRADLHGDLKSLLENLKELQKQGLLDASFHCREGVQLVFLGDYVDRGQCSIQVLELLLTLRMENPDSVTLIRGNHESVGINLGYASGDANFVRFIETEENRKLLKSVYDTLTLALFVGEKTDSRQVQYTMFTHGMFELYADPQPLLHAQPKHAIMRIPKISAEHSPEFLLSDRVKALHFTERTDYCKLLQKKDLKKEERKRIKQEWAAQKIRSLIKINAVRNKNVFSGTPSYEETLFNWGDMQEDGKPSSLGSLSLRYWNISSEDVKHYMRVISSPSTPGESQGSKVKLVFRGHEHRKQHYLHNGKVVVTTLPIGMDCPYYKDSFSGQLDTGYILTTGPKVKNWTKKAILRASGSEKTTITRGDPLTSDKV